MKRFKTHVVVPVRAALFAILLAIGMGFISPAQAGSASQPGILFLSDRSGALDLYYMDSNGANVQRMSNSGYEPGGEIEDADLSPDGATLAFSSIKLRDQTVGASGTGEIFLLNMQTGQVSPLTSDGEDNFNPVWSPDGRKVAYYSAGEDHLLQIIDPQSLKIKNLLDGRVIRDTLHLTGYVTGFDWSPNSRQIATSVQLLGPDSHSTIYLINADGTNLHQVLPDGEEAVSPSWGSQEDILYYICFHAGEEICTLNLDTGKVTQVSHFADQTTHYGFTDIDASNTDQIVFDGSNEDQTRDDIVLYDVKSGKLTNLTQGSGAFNTGPRWANRLVPGTAIPEADSNHS